MQALRKVYQMTSNTVTIDLPITFQNRLVEIILLPLDESSSPMTFPNKDWPPDFFEKTAGCLADDPIERAAQGDYEIREEIK